MDEPRALRERGDPYYRYISRHAFDGRLSAALSSCISRPPGQVPNLPQVRRPNALLVAGELLNYALRTYHGLNEYPTLVINKFGKPEMTNTPKIEYNLAHGGRFVACATSDRPVGIDVEAARANDMASILPEFAPDEIEKINSVSDAQELHACIKVWSQKEAYLKYLGIGLNIPLNSFSIYDRSTLVSLPGASEKVRIRSWEIAAGSHILSVCSEGGPITISTITETELLARKFPKSSG